VQEQDIVKLIETKFPETKVEWYAAESGESALFVPHDKIDAVVAFLKDSDELYFDYLMNLSAFDMPEHIEVTYHLYSYKHRHRFNIKIKVPRENGEINTITQLYGTAIFQEREVFDHFGVKFKNHPDLRRILLPEDWVGHPLLKDYKEQEEYNGMGTTRPSLL